jgi:hypothetical protein
MSDAPDMSDQFVHISEVEKTRHRSEDRPRVRCAVAVVRANRFAARCVLWVKELLDFLARFPSFEGFASRPAWPRIPDQALRTAASCRRSKSLTLTERHRSAARISAPNIIFGTARSPKALGMFLRRRRSTVRASWWCGLPAGASPGSAGGRCRLRSRP